MNRPLLRNKEQQGAEKTAPAEMVVPEPRRT